ncbi:MAG: GAF domain-containing protein, partial [candidate division NC10 bacterium]|nr:GAF domain-containing protein [candidate division NC10 bacterium]
MACLSPPACPGTCLPSLGDRQAADRGDGRQACLDPGLDIILADYSLPQFDALRALRLLQERGLDIPFIVVTGSIGEEMAVECIKRGAADYLLKDRLARLGLAITHALEQERARDEKRRAEEALRESEERYRRITGAVTDYIYAVRVEGGRAIQTTHGPACVAVTGYTSQDFAADPYLWLRMVDERDREAVLEQARRVLAGEDAEPIEHRIIRKDGVRRWVRNTPVPHSDAQGALLSYDGLIQDVTERKRAEEALFERALELEAIRAVTGEITRELDLDVVLGLITRRTAELVGASSVVVYLWGETAQILIPRAWHGLGEWMGKVRLELGEGVAGSVAERRQGLIVNDYRTSPYAHSLFLERAGITAVLAEPLLYRDRLVGVITANREGTEQAFTEEDRDLLTLFTAQAAIAIENARLYAQAARQLTETTALYDMSRAIASRLSLDERLEILLQRLVRAAGAQRAMISLMDAGRWSLRVAYDCSREDPWLRHLDLSSERYPEIQEVMQTRRPLVIPDVLAEPLLAPVREHLGPRGPRSLLILPLLVREQAIGAVSLGYVDQACTFTDEEIRFCQSMADLAAAAIANARLFEGVSRAKVEWENTFDSIPDLVAIIDTEQRLVRVNRALAERLRLTPEALVGQRCHAALHGTDAPPPGCPHPQTDLTGKLVTVEAEDAHLDGIFLVTTAPLYDAGGRSVGCVRVARDVTEMKRLEEEARQRQRFEDLNRAKSEFIANMSHELRTPLNAVIGFSELLLGQGVGPLTERQARFLGHIHNSGKHLLQLVSDILDLSKVEAGKLTLQPEPLRVVATLEDILIIVRGLANKKGQVIETEVEPSLPPLPADPVRFKQILFNLLSNAVKFTPGGGRVTGTARRIADCQLPIADLRNGDAGLQSQIGNR